MIVYYYSSGTWCIINYKSINIKWNIGTCVLYVVVKSYYNTCKTIIVTVNNDTMIHNDTKK